MQLNALLDHCLVILKSGRKCVTNHVAAVGRLLLAVCSYPCPAGTLLVSCRLRRIFLATPCRCWRWSCAVESAVSNRCSCVMSITAGRLPPLYFKQTMLNKHQNYARCGGTLAIYCLVLLCLLQPVLWHLTRICCRYLRINTPSPPSLLCSAARDNTLVIGSSVYFHVPNDNNLYMRLPGGAEAWAGYRQAVKPCQYGLSFNIDLAATAFLTSGPLVDVLASVLNLRDKRELQQGPLGPRYLRGIKDTVRGMRVSA